MIITAPHPWRERSSQHGPMACECREKYPWPGCAKSRRPNYHRWLLKMVAFQNLTAAPRTGDSIPCRNVAQTGTETAEKLSAQGLRGLQPSFQKPRS